MHVTRTSANGDVYLAFKIAPPSKLEEVSSLGSFKLAWTKCYKIDHREHSWTGRR